MRILDIIRKKRDGLELSYEEINFFVEEYTRNNIVDYQAAALLMAIYINGLTSRETVDLTRSMAGSGDYLSLDSIAGRKIDKHSTGGVGDTTTLIVGPIVAACGVPFAKMSGRGLGHTGGTIDKLESIPGIRLNLSEEEFQANINDINIAISSQTGNLAPADGKIYALRDVTETVDNISLIASSIMSKKLSLGTDAIVLDVKVGSGAFMKDMEEARELARIMVDIGRASSKETVALISDMDQPLGRAIGNNLEVIEAVEILKGRGPEDLRKLSIELSVEILKLAGYSEKESRSRVTEALDTGRALDSLLAMVERQSGDTSYILDTDLFPKASSIIDINSKKSGYIARIDSNLIGRAALILGAGREDLESKIDLSAGIVLNKKIGDYVEVGQALMEIHTNKNLEIIEASNLINDAITIVDKKPEKKGEIILDRII